MSDSVREAFEAHYSGKIRFQDFDFRYGRYVAKEPYVFGTDGQADRASTLFEGFKAGLSANGGEAVGIIAYSDYITADIMLGEAPRRKAIHEHGSLSIQSLPVGTKLYTHPAPPSVAVPEGWDDDAAKQLEQARQLQEAQYGSSAQTLTAAPSPDHIADAGKVDGVDGWPGSITRSQAIKILDRATDKDDPHWEFVVDDFYDEASDTMPSIFHVFAAIGVTEEEYRKATGVQNIDWPASATPSVPEEETGKVVGAVRPFDIEFLRSGDFNSVQLTISHPDKAPANWTKLHEGPATRPAESREEIQARALDAYADQLDVVFANAQRAGANDCPAWHAGQFAKDARKQASRLRTAADDGASDV